MPQIEKETLALLEGCEVLCGFSGGADSTALLLLLHSHASKGRFKLKAVHFEHGIRGAESRADASFCAGFCKSHGIAFERIDLAVPGNALPGEGIEAAARRLRLESWKRLTGPKTAVALGHNANDRAENLLLRLFRGSNATGLSSMRSTQWLNGTLFVRPLLEISRKEIEAFLKAAGLDSWRDDSTNSDEAYKRNFLRHSVIPSIEKALPYAIDGIAHSLKALQDDASFLEEAAHREWEKLKDASRPEQWLALHPALRVRALRLWLSERLGAGFVPDSKLVERFDAALKDAGTERSLIPLRESDAFIAVSSKGLELLKPSGLPEQEWNWRKNPETTWGGFAIEAVMSTETELPKDNWSALFDASALPGTLLLGRWREGERMTVIGRKSPERVKELFNKAGVSSVERESHPILRMPSGEALWIPGVRRGNFAVVDGQSQTLRLTAKKPLPL